MAKTIALVGSLDTKGEEYRFVKQCIEARGHRVLLVDTGVLGEPKIAADITSRDVAGAAGGDLDDLIEEQDRGEAVATMQRGVEVIVPRLFAEGRFDAIMALGGGGGTSIACAAMRTLPLGVPKVMVSTVAGTDVSGYVESLATYLVALAKGQATGPQPRLPGEALTVVRGSTAPPRSAS